MIRLTCTCVDFGIASEGLVLVVLYHCSSSDVRERNSSSIKLTSVTTVRPILRLRLLRKICTVLLLAGDVRCRLQRVSCRQSYKEMTAPSTATRFGLLGAGYVLPTPTWMCDR